MDKYEQEIIDLHVFFEDWFTGRCENNEATYQPRLFARFDPELHIIFPGGVMMSLREFWPDLLKAYGKNPAFAIRIRNVALQSPADVALVVVTYEEWQRNAASSEPANNGRLSTAVFKHDDSAPNGLRWMHVHETWLPKAVVAAHPFDW